MCGIVGWVGFKDRSEDVMEIIKNMADQLVHRGPDAEGFWFSEQAALGHRRLVVVDPEGGKQPMVSANGNYKYTLVYNGELYNTEDIRQVLTGKGYNFEGWSDTEVLLKAYIEWGEKCVYKLNGIFAFAIWDDDRKRLFLARDRLGVKPLFYWQKGGSFLFASEIKAILSHPLVSARVNQEGLAEIFALGPARTPGHGVFSGIHELKPGNYMHVDQKGIRSRQYWSLNSHTHEDSFEQTVDTVKELVFDAIKRQLISDVPLCALLSGGLDSSAITAVASEVYRNENQEAIKTFSVDYVGNDQYFKAGRFQPHADAPWVNKVSEYLGTRHASYLIDTPELVESLFPAVIARDLPGMTDIDSSLWLFSRWIKNQATVGISGECADEVFGGYPWFYNTSAKNLFPWSQRLDIRTKLYSKDLIRLIKAEEYVTQRYREAIEETPRLAEDEPIDAQMRELFYLNLTRWMPTLLDRKDRMSMAAGLELRVPFCDHRLVEYVWNVPWTMKNYNNREKGLLRLALKGILPEDVLWREKSPYPKTHNPSFIAAVRGLILSILDDPTSPILPLINSETVRDLALSVRRDTDIPWFGQLMNAPQLLAYLVQIDFWLKEYRITIV
ncbi:asparagine synthase (glutamine-hydrolyzing) [Syntrophomonas palmitatica]|uniref:asparagine synthase (glutamine-hydrolyzing) n=1 Tax=Syntrophomonas palmitatica TaxID=402877 RepID=UPI0006CF23DE|nr:asparagine synthase (glutamine-hydrolyzing) [Syntrophomonas palmitatica]